MEPGELKGKEDVEPCLTPVGNDLDPYRRLVEMQRQIIELKKQCDEFKRESDRLREQMAGELVGGSSAGLAKRVHKFTSRRARQVVRMGARMFRAMETGVTIRHKRRSSQS